MRPFQMYHAIKIRVEFTFGLYANYVCTVNHDTIKQIKEPIVNALIDFTFEVNKITYDPDIRMKKASIIGTNDGSGTIHTRKVSHLGWVIEVTRSPVTMTRSLWGKGLIYRGTRLPACQ